MKHYLLDHHSSYCSFKNADNILFQYDYDFHLLTHCSCLNGYSHLDFKEEVFKSFSANKKDGSVINRAMTVKHFMSSDFDKLINKKVEEVIFIYFDNAGKKYHFTKKIPFSDYARLLDQYNNNYRSAVKFIKESELTNKDYFLSELLDLYSVNHSELAYDWNQAKIITKIDLETKKMFKNEIS